MKYKLKKELPFAPIGSIIESDSVGLFVRCESKNFLTWYIEEKHELQNLINNGWIEEVKPREWYIGLTKNDLPCYVGEGKPYEDRVHYNFMSSINNEFELIKVREVIE